MNYTLQYASNFFLNLHRQRNFQKMLIPSSENLALLGNICSLDTDESRKSYKDFLHYVTKGWKNIYIVPGPWEMASMEPRAYETNIKSLYALKKDYGNLHILNNSIVSLPNVNIQLIGSTLWSKKIYPSVANYIWQKHFQGFRNITETHTKFWHKEDIQFLINTIDPDMRYIVLTHHSPIIIQENIVDINLDKYMKKPIEIWLGGSGDRHITGTLGENVFCGTNPYTLFSTAKNTMISSYNPEAYISLKTSPLI